MSAIGNNNAWVKSSQASANVPARKKIDQNIDPTGDPVFQNMLASRLQQSQTTVQETNKAQLADHQSEREIDHGRSATQHANHSIKNTNDTNDTTSTEANPKPTDTTVQAELGNTKAEHPVYADMRAQTSNTDMAGTIAPTASAQSERPVSAQSDGTAQRPSTAMFGALGESVLSGVQSAAALGASVLSGTALGQGATAIAGIAGKIGDFAQTLGAAVDSAVGIGKNGLSDVSQIASLTDAKATAGSSSLTTGLDKNSSNIQSPFGTAQWDQEINQKVVWMVGGAEQSASLTLNPPDLGPLQVVVHVHNNMANATFISDNPEVRQALTDSLQSLRDMMSQSGIELGQANVSSGEAQRSHITQLMGNSNDSVTAGSLDQDVISATGAQRIKSLLTKKGLVDTFA